MFRDGGGGFISRLLGPLESSVTQMVEEDVTAEQKATFQREMARLRESLDSGDVTVVDVQPIIQEMQSATRDQKISSEELDRINEMLLSINDGEAAPGQDEPAGEEVPEGTIEL